MSLRQQVNGVHKETQGQNNKSKAESFLDLRTRRNLHKLLKKPKTLTLTGELRNDLAEDTKEEEG
jgi:hypothetical protein